MKVKPRKLKVVSGLPSLGAPLSAFRRKASELDEPGLLGMQRQRNLYLEPLAHLFQEAPGVALVLEPRR